MKTWALAWLATAVPILVLDAIWLSTAASRLYRPELGDMLAADFRWRPALAFYLIFVSGIVHFAVMPGLTAGRWMSAAINGALFGFCAYATYDLTSQAVLRHWTTRVTLFDLAWGTLLSGIGAGLAYALLLRLSR